MSKSTPISQLPSSDNGSMQGDVIEDDATVQEVLNQISQSSGVSDVQQMPSSPRYQTQAPSTPTSISASSMLRQQQHQQQQQFDQHQQQYMAQQMAQAQQLPGTAQQLLAQQPQAPVAQPFYFQMPPYQPTQVETQSPAGALYDEPIQSPSSISNEIRLILLVVIVAIVIQIIPVDLLIQRINILSKIPYSHIFVKACLAGVLFFAIRKYVS
jgi:hypothetical protein